MLLFILNTLLARHTEVNATLNNFFTGILVFDELLIENENVLQNGVLKLTMSA